MQRLGFFELGNASIGLGLLIIFINTTFYFSCKINTFFGESSTFFVFNVIVTN